MIGRDAYGEGVGDVAIDILTAVDFIRWMHGGQSGTRH